MMGGFRSRKINTHPEITTGHVRLSVSSISTKLIINWQHSWLKRKHNTIYTNSWPYIFILSFFSAFNGFLKTKSINQCQQFLEDKSQKAFLPRIFLLDFPRFSFNNLFSQGFLNYLQCARYFGWTFTDIISNCCNNLAMQIFVAPIYKWGTQGSRMLSKLSVSHLT